MKKLLLTTLLLTAPIATFTVGRQYNFVGDRLQESILASHHASHVTAGGWEGTAFPITEQSFYTAWHVVQGVPFEAIKVGSLQVIGAYQIANLDVAILFTAPHGLEPWPLADRNARPGERIFKSGYGKGQHWWTEGIATEDPDRIAINIFPGDSGGPVFNEQGEVLGIMVMLDTYGAQGLIMHQAYMVPLPVIRAARDQ